MANNQLDQIQVWLDLLCQTVPGIGQAVLIQKPGTAVDQVLRWPVANTSHTDLMTAARLAASQNQVVTSTLSGTQDNDSAVDTIIALPLLQSDSSKRTLGVLVTIKPSQQPSVIRILRWGEKWLKLVPEDQQPLNSDKKAVSLSSVSNSVWNKLKEKCVNPNGSTVQTLLTSMRASWKVLSVLLLLLVSTFVTGTYRVTASANLEGKIQRAIVAPFDGFVVATHARAGKTVSAGEVIAELDTEELRQEQYRYTAEINEYDHEYRKALSMRDHTQAHIYKSRVSQAEAQLNLLNKKIERSSLVSTIDGVIISGDLSRSLGAPVKTGDMLFEVAPLDEYRLIIMVDEKQVVDVTKGLNGNLSLKSMPGEKLPFVVHKVSPVFSEDANGITYRVEARLSEQNSSLRPGMEGIAKIDIEKRRIGWIYFHKLFDLVRLWVWRWLP